MSDKHGKLIASAEQRAYYHASKGDTYDNNLYQDLIAALRDNADEIAVLREAGREQDGALRDMERTVKMQHRALQDTRNP